MENITVRLKIKKRLKVAVWIERNVPIIFENKKIQKLFLDYFEKFDNCVKVKLI